MEIALSLPFAVDSYGKISTTTDYAKMWSDRVRAVIGTNRFKRVMSPDFGTKISSAVYKSQEEAESTVKTEIEMAFQRHLPLLKLSSVQVENDVLNGSILARIVYSLPNLKVTETVISIAYVEKTNPIFEETV